MQEINKRRDRLMQLASERKSLRDQMSTMYARRNALEETITQANMALNDRAKHWQEVDSLTARRDAAKRERADLAPKIQAAERNDRMLSEQERDCRKDIAQAEYLNTTAADVQAEIDAALTEVREADTKLANLHRERASLEAKREQAKRAADVVRSADSELLDARDSQEQQKAQAFIAGREIDLAPYSARIAKAEKRLGDAKCNADAGLAALPIIADRLNTLAGMLDEGGKEREAAKGRYWLARTRLLEITWRHQLEGLIETAKTMRALGRKTGRQQGHRLYESVRGLLVPTTADSDYPQPVKLTEPEDGALLNRLESELEATLLAEEETV